MSHYQTSDFLQKLKEAPQFCIYNTEVKEVIDCNHPEEKIMQMMWHLNFLPNNSFKFVFAKQSQSTNQIQGVLFTCDEAIKGNSMYLDEFNQLKMRPSDQFISFVAIEFNPKGFASIQIYSPQKKWKWVLPDFSQKPRPGYHWILTTSDYTIGQQFPWAFLALDEGTFHNKDITLASKNQLSTRFQAKFQLNAQYQAETKSYIFQESSTKTFFSVQFSPANYVRMGQFSQKQSSWRVVRNVITGEFYLLSISNYLFLMNNQALVMVDDGSLQDGYHSFSIDIINNPGEKYSNKIQKDLDNFSKQNPNVDQHPQYKNYEESKQSFKADKSIGQPDYLVSSFLKSNNHKPGSHTTDYIMPSDIHLNYSEKQTNSTTADSINKPEYYRIKNKGSGKYLQVEGQNIVESMTQQNSSVFHILKEPFDPLIFKISFQGQLVGVSQLRTTAKIQILKDSQNVIPSQIQFTLDKNTKSLMISTKMVSLVGGMLFAVNIPESNLSSSLIQYSQFILEKSIEPPSSNQNSSGLDYQKGTNLNSQFSQPEKNDSITKYGETYKQYSQNIPPQIKQRSISTLDQQPSNIQKNQLDTQYQQHQSPLKSPEQPPFTQTQVSPQVSMLQSKSSDSSIQQKLVTCNKFCLYNTEVKEVMDYDSQTKSLSCMWHMNGNTNQCFKFCLKQQSSSDQGIIGIIESVLYPGQFFSLTPKYQLILAEQKKACSVCLEFNDKGFARILLMSPQNKWMVLCPDQKYPPQKSNEHWGISLVDFNQNAPFSWAFLAIDSGTFRNKKILITTQSDTGQTQALNTQTGNRFIMQEQYNIYQPNKYLLMAKFNNQTSLYSFQQNAGENCLSVTQNAVTFGTFDKMKSSWTLIKNITNNDFYLMSREQFYFLSSKQAAMTVDIPNIQKGLQSFNIQIHNNEAEKIKEETKEMQNNLDIKGIGQQEKKYSAGQQYSFQSQLEPKIKQSSNSAFMNKSSISGTSDNQISGNILQSKSVLYSRPQSGYQDNNTQKFTQSQIYGNSSQPNQKFQEQYQYQKEQEAIDKQKYQQYLQLQQNLQFDQLQKNQWQQLQQQQQVLKGQSQFNYQNNYNNNFNNNSNLQSNNSAQKPNELIKQRSTSYSYKQ